MKIEIELSDTEVSEIVTRELKDLRQCLESDDDPETVEMVGHIDAILEGEYER